MEAHPQLAEKISDRRMLGMFILKAEFTRCADVAPDTQTHEFEKLVWRILKRSAGKAIPANRPFPKPPQRVIRLGDIRFSAVNFIAEDQIPRLTTNESTVQTEHIVAAYRTPPRMELLIRKQIVKNDPELRKKLFQLRNQICRANPKDAGFALALELVLDYFDADPRLPGAGKSEDQPRVEPTGSLQRARLMFEQQWYHRPRCLALIALTVITKRATVSTSRQPKTKAPPTNITPPITHPTGPPNTETVEDAAM